MDLFFLVSKIGWFVVAPANFIVLMLAVGIGMWRWPRTTKYGRWIAMGAVSTLFAVVVLPIGDILVRGLEQRFPPFAACSPPKPIRGIILLGGASGSKTVAGRIEEDLNGGADRIRYAATLARANPAAPILVSGGQVFARKGARNEADTMADILVELGISRDRLILEGASRTTAENAAFVRDQAGSGQGAWLLVTSAFHMPRSIGTFRKAGIDVIAAPTDWQVDDNAPLLLAGAADRLGKLDLAVREYLGLLAYGITGRSDSLFPGPRPTDSCA